MTITQTSEAQGAFSTRLKNRCAFAVTVSVISEASASTVSSFYDSEVRENLSADAYNQYTFSPQLDAEITLESMNPSIASVNGMVVDQVVSGRTYIKITEGGVSRFEFVDVMSSGGQTVREFDGYAPNTVAAACADELVTLVNAGGTVAYFSTSDHAAGSYTKNAGCWAANIDLSAVSVAHNSGLGWTRRRACTLITPEHFRTSEHFAPPVGSTVRWVTPAGVVVDRVVAGYSTVSTLTFDSIIGVLASPTVGISPVQVVGAWFEQGVANVGSFQRNSYIGGLAFYIDQFAAVYACQLGNSIFLQQTGRASGSYESTAFANVNDKWFTDHSASGPYLQDQALLTKLPVDGDSSSPVFVLIGGNPVLVMTWWTSISGTPIYQSAGLLAAQVSSANTNAGVSSSATVTVAPDPTL